MGNGWRAVFTTRQRGRDDLFPTSAQIEDVVFELHSKIGDVHRKVSPFPEWVQEYNLTVIYYPTTLDFTCREGVEMLGLVAEVGYNALSSMRYINLLHLPVASVRYDIPAQGCRINSNNGIQTWDLLFVSGSQSGNSRQ
jgi:hypothetical protein